MEDPTTQELRLEQLRREVAEREAAGGASSPDDTEQHERRADKASYLRDKLEDRADSERRASDED